MTNRTNQYIPRPFNSPIESGLRALFILNADFQMWFDLQRLVYYDYLLIHSGDVPGGPKSLHPDTPFRGAEWIVSRKKIEDGLNLMFSKDLICKSFSKSGIQYCSTELTGLFLNYLTNEYSNLLKERANWVKNNFDQYSSTELDIFIRRNLKNWDSEYISLT